MEADELRDLVAGQGLRDAVDAARREQAALATLAGRTWRQAPGPWLERERARIGRWMLQGALTPAEWDTLARADIIGSLSRFHAERQDPRNWFHPRTLGRLDEIVPFVMNRRGWQKEIGDVVDALPPLHSRLNAEAIEAFIRAEVDRRQVGAADPVLLTDDRPGAERRANRSGERWLTVQHQASGLRAIFKYTPGETQGHVVSKSYKIESIDPTRPEDPIDRAPDWRDWVGLGIGERIYLKAAELLPEQRWGATSVTPAAAALRVKLHARDPWRWWSRTCTCRSSWEDLTVHAAEQADHTQIPKGDH